MRLLINSVIYGAHLTNFYTFLDLFVFLTLKNKKRAVFIILGLWMGFSHSLLLGCRTRLCFLCKIHEAKIRGEVMICSFLILMGFM